PSLNYGNYTFWDIDGWDGSEPATLELEIGDGSGSSNASPSISAIADVSISENSSAGPLAFTVGDAETSASGLTLSKASSDETLIPLSGIVYGGSDENRTVSVTPAAGLSGSATITVSVSDGVNTVSTDFVLTVTDVNDAPTITLIEAQTIAEDSSTGSLAFTIGDEETSAGSLTLGKASSDETLIPVSGIVFGGSDGNRTVSVTPAAGLSGSATVTISVSDGVNTASTDFVVTVEASDTGSGTTRVESLVLSRQDKGAQSNGATTWHTEDKVRVGGSGNGVDAAMVIPFALPA
ncbi:cadherin-like domain-containing protein, partial [Puniceicoccaceae bacterium K14]|nr:cadherin-like domain-containing protein [Puniceicoccaceae bacterium K14]